MPWVAVEVAPAIDCLSMSPRFGNARPRSNSCAFSSWSRMPACTVTSVPSTSRIRFIPSSDTRCPSVIAASVNEWPPPIAFTRWPDSAARWTIAATSSVVVGSCTASGTHR